MYDHMKCRPKSKRTYRRINQRSTASEESITYPTISVSRKRSACEIIAEQPVATPELTAGLPHWTVTAPRGRKLAPHKPATGSPGVFQEASKKLCLTVQDEMSKDSSSKKIIRLNERGADKENYNQDMHRKRPYRLSGLEEERKEQSKCETSIQSVSSTSKIEQQAVIARYECGTCRKTFSSTEALGSHMRSRRNKKCRSSGRAGQLQKEEPSGSKSHTCQICHKQFPSGPALGGHKSSHSRGGSAIAPAKSAALKEEAVTGGRLNFSLNELPPTEDEEVVTGGRHVLNFDLNELPQSKDEKAVDHEES